MYSYERGRFIRIVIVYARTRSIEVAGGTLRMTHFIKGLFNVAVKKFIVSPGKNREHIGNSPARLYRFMWNVLVAINHDR